ncbi:negative regulator of DNA transposition protein [Sporothrix brasiliensis 5110]|uniref:Negative regulator of DNA transposition protein n=1 Tax=Sporothrix brasiliensis 5110 TaxID=1398154 RepID=A0A0C2FFZ2_9PEZI|nr:negative regulator of DNA transposition protein [Sporothrix brasiliensis 5110]KIH90033.1 negative regulator of DNA transposition protein [Sporothrix brasiliensis 5110]
MASLDTERLSLAFQSRPDLVEQIRAAAAKSPAHTPLFNSIAGYVYEQVHGGGEPAHKRRRVEAEDEANRHSHSALPARQGTAETASQNGSTGTGGGGREPDLLSAAAAETVLLEVKDISVSIPQRKKYDLCFTKNYLYARAANTTTPVPGIVYAWTDFEYVFYLPVPEKTQVQYNYILFPRHAALASLSKPTPAAAAVAPTVPPPPPPTTEPLVFTVPATAPKPGQVGGPSAGLAAAVSDSYTTLFHWAIEGQLRSAENVYLARQRTIIVAADPNVFHSAARQPFRPAEKAVHVRAFRGSKDGYLFFLPTGILWGFKKPLLFLPLDRIVAVSYTNVLQRTFNIVVEVDVGAGTGADDNEEVEFGMLDQEDYGGISETYVQRHNLQDRSMAERRKAKRELAENARGDKTANGEGGADGGAAGASGDGVPDDGLTELQRAEQRLQDEEDEDEEDYDPGSDGDSDGSGSSDEEGTEDGEEVEGDEDEDGEEGEDGDEE